MRKLWKKIRSWFTRLDTKDARRGLAGDFSKAFWTLMTVIGLSLPGAYSGVVLEIANALGAEWTALPFTVSWTTTVSLVVLAVTLRVVQFLLECDIEKNDKPAGKVKSKR